ncbi:MAG: hypothetical protein ACF8QF_03370 [Phycisphaerales bacterium]
MGINEYKRDEDRIDKFSALRGLSAEERDSLKQRATERAKAFDQLSRDDAVYRFEPVSDQMLEQWLLEISEGPTLFG